MKGAEPFCVCDSRQQMIGSKWNLIMQRTLSLESPAAAIACSRIACATIELLDFAFLRVRGITCGVTRSGARSCAPPDICSRLMLIASPCEGSTGAKGSSHGAFSAVAKDEKSKAAAIAIVVEY